MYPTEKEYAEKKCADMAYRENGSRTMGSVGTGYVGLGSASNNQCDYRPPVIINRANNGFIIVDGGIQHIAKDSKEVRAILADIL